MSFVRDTRINDQLVELTSDPRQAVRMAAKRSLFISADARALDTYLAGQNLDEISFPHIEISRTGELLSRLLKLAQNPDPRLRAKVLAQISFFEYPDATRAMSAAVQLPNGLLDNSLVWSYSPERVTCLLGLLAKNINLEKAISVAERLRDPRARVALAAGLQDADANRRFRFASALRHVNGSDGQAYDKEVRVALMQLAAKDPEKSVRVAALLALGDDGGDDSAARKILFDALADGEKDMSEAAANALGRGHYSLDDASVYFPFLAHSNPAVRAGIFRALTLSSDPRARDWALKEAQSLDGKLCAVSIRLLFVNPRALPVIEQLAAHSDARVRREVLNAMVLNKVPRNLAQLSQLAKDSDPYVRIGALGMLAGTADSAEVAVIAAGLNDSDANVKGTAAQILRELNSQHESAKVDMLRVRQAISEANRRSLNKSPDDF